jgi:hypothetical protein
MFWWRKKQPPKAADITKPAGCPNGETNGTTEEITGVHERTMDVLRGSRQTLQELIAQLDDIKKQAEEIVHSGDLPGSKKESAT